MKKITLRYHRFILLSGMLLGGLFASAQDVQKHTVQTGETLSQIAGKYGTTVGDIMRFNGMDTNSKLEVGASIKIPPAGVHIIGKSVNKTTSTAKAPVKKEDPNAGKTHTVVAGESLYKISKAYGISVAELKSLNNLSDANIKVGQVLKLSDKASVDTAVSVTPSETASEKSGEEKKQESQPVKEEKKPEVTAPTKSKTSGKDSVKIVSTETTVLANGGGAFSDQFGRDVESMSLAEVNGKAKIFKSQSGWSDQKFYIMMNDVTPGGIVKVTYNGTSIFAKVLWNLIDTKENNGLSFRLSDAAASALSITGDNSFDLKVDYYK